MPVRIAALLGQSNRTLVSFEMRNRRRSKLREQHPHSLLRNGRDHIIQTPYHKFGAEFGAEKATWSMIRLSPVEYATIRIIQFCTIQRSHFLLKDSYPAIRGNHSMGMRRTVCSGGRLVLVSANLEVLGAFGTEQRPWSKLGSRWWLSPELGPSIRCTIAQIL